MRKTTILLFGLLLSVTTVFARQISKQETYEKAQQFMQNNQATPKSDDYDFVQFGVHTIDGITYNLYSVYGSLMARVLPYNETEKYKGDIYIPDSISYQNMIFNITDIDSDLFHDSPELTSLSTPIQLSIRLCPKLTSIEIREGATRFAVISKCPLLESITYPATCSYIAAPTYCEKLSSITIKKRNVSINTNEEDCWSKESMPALTDIYLAGNFPPSSSPKRKLPKVYKDINIHIPQGAIEVYNHSEWKNGNLIEDQPPILVAIHWDYCGNDERDHGVFWVGRGDNNVDHAIGIPAEQLAAYKDCRISAIEFYTDYQFDDSSCCPEYVFITTPDIDYLAKQSVKTTTLGTWTRIELDQPYIITGEKLFVGIGRHHDLKIYRISDNYVKGGCWTRAMGNDYSNYMHPGVWEEHKSNKGYPPFAIRAIIEGEKLPTDIVVTNPELISADVTKQMRLKLCSRTPRLVKQITLDWSIDGNKQEPYILETALLPNHEDVVYIDLPNNIAGRNHTVNFNVSNVDGEPDMIQANSNVEANYSMATTTTYFPRKIVMEEATGTWCPHSPDGIVTIEKMNERYPDNFIAIAIHNDELEPTDDNYYPFYSMVTEFPSAHINRSYWDGLLTFDLDETKDQGEAIIKANAEFTSGNQVTVNTKTTFGFSDNGSTEYRIAYVVVEDNVGPYYQANYYSDPNAADDPNNPMNWWVHQDSYVEIMYNDVARTIYNYDGIAGQLPKEITEGETYKCQYTLTLPNNIQNVENLKIVTLLIDTYTGEILNADRTTITGEYNTTAIQTIKAVETDTPAYTLSGQKISSGSLKGKKGIYIINGKKIIIK